MTVVVVPVPSYDIEMPRGATRTLRFTITRDGANVPLTLPGTALVFTAKRRRTETAAVQKAYAATGATLPSGVAAGGIDANHIDTNGDTIPDTWVADMTLNPADTEDITDPILEYDLWLIDPSGQESPVARGALRLTPTVLRP